MTTQEEAKKIQECIMNIDMMCRSMYLSYVDTIKLKIPKKSVIYADMVRYSYIRLCSILNELSILNRLAKTNDYLKDTLYVASPATRALNKYTGIRKARNFLLAHYNRDKSGNFFPWWKALKNLKLPRTHKEVKQIYVWLHLINGIIITRYSDELKEIFAKSRSEFKSYNDWMVEQENDAVANPTPFDNIEIEVEKRVKEKNIGDIEIDPIMTDLIKYINNYG